MGGVRNRVWIEGRQTHFWLVPAANRELMAQRLTTPGCEKKRQPNMTRNFILIRTIVGKQRQEDIWEFDVNLVYIVSSKPARATH